MACQKPADLSKRVLLKNIFERGDGGSGMLGKRVVVGGWVKCAMETPKCGGSNEDMCCAVTFQCRIQISRSREKVCSGTKINCSEKPEAVSNQPPQSIFILTVSDGSCVAGLQIVVDSSLARPSGSLLIGTCILAEGILKKPSKRRKHLIELIVDKIHHIGSVTRIGSAMTFAVHSFFRNNGFFYVQLPTITTTHAEGFGTKFLVTTLDRKEAKEEEQRHPNKVEGLGHSIKAAVMEKSKLIEELKSTNSCEEALFLAKKDLQKTKELVSMLKGDNMNFSKDFFPRQTYLTVSGRLHLESYACALGNVYSCGPRFRADRCSKQSAEMWMVETEIAFSRMEDVIKLALDLLKWLCKRVLEDCSEDMKFLQKRIDQTNIARLKSTISSSFQRLSYTDAKKITDENPETKLEVGAALTTKQLSYLADEYYQVPLIIYNYPKEVKPFYVRLNDGGATVAAFDIILPKGGKVISGSQNEERFEMLEKRMEELKLPKEEYEWCLQLRRYGTVEHSGFSLDLDSFLVFAQGLPEVQDVIPFPRSYGEAKN